MAVTPNIGLQLPSIGQNNWGGPLNFNFQQLDLFLSGHLPIAALNITGNMVIGGTVTAAGFIGLDGEFLTSASYDQPDGIPQLNADALIDPALQVDNLVDVVGFSATPIFDATKGGVHNLTLTGNVTSSTFINGVDGPALVAFRFTQDGTGGRTFVWPANVHNHGDIWPDPGTKSTQLFALNTDGSLDAVGPMLYS